MEALFFYLVFIGIAGWMPAKWNSGRKERELGRRPDHASARGWLYVRESTAQMRPNGPVLDLKTDCGGWYGEKTSGRGAVPSF